jgi:hypothetical protein
LAAREYLREPLDTFSDPYVTDLALCFGSQLGKTQLLMSGLGWIIVNEPTGVLWVMPSEQLARNLSETRWIPIARASPALNVLIPGGKKRHSFKKLHQEFGPSVLNFVGSNSPANLAARPARVVICDETDKFPMEQKTEADAVSLAEQRTKSFPLPKRIRTSTPTLTDGLIWQSWLRGDQRRFFIPCPHCAKEVVLAWSADFTVFARTGAEAYICWDKEARRPDRTWDLDRVRASAHALCPHCGGQIRDEQKTRLIRNGHWRPTLAAGNGFGVRSYHLSSLYAPTPQTSFGALAIKFLRQKNSTLGIQDFINGELAEPWENQESRGERLELVSPPDAPPLPESVPLMTVDVQAVSPYFWVIIRAWTKGGHSRLVCAAHADDWETIRRLQENHAVQNHHVLIDSGHRTAEVYQQCLRWTTPRPVMGRLPQAIGWIPAKGRERQMHWVHRATGRSQPYFYGSAALPPNTRLHLPLLEFAADYFLDILNRFRRGPDAAGGLQWELIGFPAGNPTPGAVLVTEDEYRRQIDAKILKAFASGRTGRVEQRWVLRSSKWPDHILDCEIMEVAWAMAHNRLPWARNHDLIAKLPIMDEQR